MSNDSVCRMAKTYRTTLNQRGYFACDSLGEFGCEMCFWVQMAKGKIQEGMLVSWSFWRCLRLVVRGRTAAPNLSPCAVTMAHDLCSLLDLMDSAGAGLVDESTYTVTLVVQVLIFLLPFHVSLRTKILIWKNFAHITLGPFTFFSTEKSLFLKKEDKIEMEMMLGLCALLGSSENEQWLWEFIPDSILSFMSWLERLAI